MYMSSVDRRLSSYADVVAGLSLPTAELSSDRFYGSVFKPFLDRLLALIFLIPASLIIAICALLIVRDGHSPFYRQKRIGKDGVHFGMWKLRSMVPDADQVLESYLSANPEARREWDLTQKLKFDPRVTPIGRIIRKTSIDELPQLWNVLVGDMSLVGPRPMMLDQRVLYPGVAYFAMRPGITGYWQTTERNETSFAERAVYDTEYFSDMSLATDATVIFKTVGVVLKGTGY